MLTERSRPLRAIPARSVTPLKNDSESKKQSQNGSGLGKLLVVMKEEGVEDVRRLERAGGEIEIKIENGEGTETKTKTNPVGLQVKLRGWMSRDNGGGGKFEKKDASSFAASTPTVDRTSSLVRGAYLGERVIARDGGDETDALSSSNLPLALSEVPREMRDEVAAILQIDMNDLWPEEKEKKENEEVALSDKSVTKKQVQDQKQDQAKEKPRSFGLQKLNERHHRMILAQLSGLTRRQLSRLFGTSYGNVLAITNSDLYIQELNFMRDKLKNQHTARISGMQGQALDVLADIMASEGDKISVSMKFNAAKFLLGLGEGKSESAAQTQRHDHRHKHVMEYGETVLRAMEIAKKRQGNDPEDVIDAQIVE